MPDTFKEMGEILEAKGWRRQSCGNVYVNGEKCVNFYKDGEVFHIRHDEMPDDEVLKRISGRD